MPVSVPDSLIGMIFLVFMLGLRHGMDPDHLATIDGMARANSVVRPRLARWAGLLFSLGHGLTVILTAGMISLLAQTWQVPVWFEALGAWISIFFLLALGLTNLYVVFRVPSGEVVKITGAKSRIFRFLFARIQHPGWMVLVGVLFALSFDTMSQVAFFSISVQTGHSWMSPMLLGLVFMLGMIVTDGLNGYWVAKMILRTDKLALVSSRVLGLTVAGLSLVVGGMGLSRQLFPDVDILTNISPLHQGIGLIAFIATSYVVALWLSRPKNIFSI
ncbi:nickel transporter [Sulfuriferula nivalis]|uniref:Nickel/cobalt efflux system n=1 Tax=Sulfuriferula nivalis TaxID=2675298 RepID=A0A809SDN9_9PROT|nr:nickel transporter [Sulfuriferula nivalis]BBP00727.1 nickel/cobalt efflux system [Sulfuriferula nivalis]